MMRPFLCAVLVVSALMGGCSDTTSQKAPSHPAAPTKPAPVSPAPVSPATPPTSLPAPVAAGVGSPTTEVVFADVASCQLAGYTPKQCTDALGVSQSMSRALLKVYATARDCAMYFQECAARKGAHGESGFFPRMTGFSLGNQKPGVEIAPSPQNPLFYAPVYKDTRGHSVYILVDAHDNLLAMPVMPKGMPKSPSSPENALPAPSH